MSEYQSSTSVATLRVLDANANRAREGLRVIEDVARFEWNDPEIAGRCKDLRHRISQLLDPFRGAMLAARDTAGDVGTSLEGASEGKRATTEDLIHANFGRLQEALRTMEEHSKRIEPALGRSFECVRYEVYDLHRIAARISGARARLASMDIYALLGASDSLDAFARTLDRYLEAGVRMFQLRVKHRDDRTTYRYAEAMRRRLNRVDTLMIVNDRPDIAVAVGADGVHVGQEELPCSAVRRVVGGEMLIGISTHNLRQVRQATEEGADYLGCGPVFPSATKSFDKFPGLDFLREVGSWASLPAFAIGGIDDANVHEVVAAGFHQIAVGSALAGAEDLSDRVQRLRRPLAVQGETA